MSFPACKPDACDQQIKNKNNAEKLKQQKEINEEYLELKRNLDKTEIEGELQFQMLEKQQNDSQKEKLKNTETAILNGIANLAKLRAKQSLDDQFNLFKQQCNILCSKYKLFECEFNISETLILQAVKMRNQSEIDMDDLLSSLRVFSYYTTEFNAEGSGNDAEFISLVNQILPITENIKTELISIQSRMENESDSNGDIEHEVVKELILVNDYMTEMSDLIKKVREARRNLF